MLNGGSKGAQRDLGRILNFYMVIPILSQKKCYVGKEKPILGIENRLYG